jgi:protein JSN1
VLEEVLMDQVHGVGVVQKVLASPYVEPFDKQNIAEKVKDVLNKLKVSQVQGYKRLLEELAVVLGDNSIGPMPGGSYSNYQTFYQQTEGSPSQEAESASASQQKPQQSFYPNPVPSQMTGYPQAYPTNNSATAFPPSMMYASPQTYNPSMYGPAGYSYPQSVMSGNPNPNPQLAALLGGAAPGAQPTGQQQEGSA